MARTVRTLAMYKSYLRKQAHDFCTFCEPAETNNQILEELQGFFIIKNKFPYSMWDRSHVTDHIMLVPKRHIIGVSDFTPEEATEYHAAMAKLEAHGYTFYTRSPVTKTKSIHHLHTHGIQLGKFVTPLSFIKVLL